MTTKMIAFDSLIIPITDQRVHTATENTPRRSISTSTNPFLMPIFFIKKLSNMLASFTILLQYIFTCCIILVHDLRSLSRSLHRLLPSKILVGHVVARRLCGLQDLLPRLSSSFLYNYQNIRYLIFVSGSLLDRVKRMHVIFRFGISIGLIITALCMLNLPQGLFLNDQQHIYMNSSFTTACVILRN